MLNARGIGFTLLVPSTALNEVTNTQLQRQKALTVGATRSKFAQAWESASKNLLANTSAASLQANVLIPYQAKI